MSGKKDLQIELLREILASLRRIEVLHRPTRTTVGDYTYTTSPGEWINPGLHITSKAEAE